MKETNKQQSKFIVVFFLVLYKAKIALTSFVLKIALKRLVSRDVAKYAVPYMAVPATMLWNSLIAHSVGSYPGNRYRHTSMCSFNPLLIDSFIQVTRLAP